MSDWEAAYGLLVVQVTLLPGHVLQRLVRPADQGGE